VAQLLGLSNDDVKTIGAGATTVGVLLALFAPAVTHWWRRPLLTLEFERDRAEPHWDRVRPRDDLFFLRLRVRNARGCDTAERVEVLISSYRALGLGLEGRALEWSGQRERAAAPVTTIDIAPGLQRHVDVLQIGPAVTRDRRRSWMRPNHGTHARLCVYPKPVGGAQVVPEGDHRIVATVTAANANTVSYEFVLSYDGAMTADIARPPRRVRRRTWSEAFRSVLKWASRGFRTPDF
jgi:hypothetical protein